MSEPGRLWSRIRASGAALILTAALLIGCSSEPWASAYLKTHSAALHQAVSATPQPMQFVVPSGATARSIAAALQAQGLIGDARLFEAYVRASGLADRLQAGTYTLSPHMTPVQIAEALLHARPPTIQVTIPEGWRLEQIADSLTVSGVMDGAAYRRLAEARDLPDLGVNAAERYPFLLARPVGATLEGYLYPATYELFADQATPEALLQRQLDAFAAQVMPLYRELTAGQPRPLSLHEVLTLASIVEREAVVDDERPMIAGVYLNRLARGIKLEADPTVQYAMGYQPETGQWWKSPVYLEEYSRVLSPYNTYLHAGLPPGPIANPGRRSIAAVLNPTPHEYLYLMALGDGSGRHAFARTFAEHLENVRRYQGRQP